jgi:hypothetical protein
MSFFMGHGLDPAGGLDGDAIAGCAPGGGLALAGSMGSSFLDVDGVFGAGCGLPSAQNFLLPDELPSPLDGSGAGAAAAGPAPLKPALLPAHGGLMLPLPEDGPLGGAGGFGPGDGSMGSMYSDYTAGGGGLAGPGASAGGAQGYAEARGGAGEQPRRLYHLVLVSPDTGAPVRTATDDDAAAVARMLESESGCSGFSVAGGGGGGGGLPRALSFVAGGGAGRSDDGDGEEVGGGGGGRSQAGGTPAKRQRTGKQAHTPGGGSGLPGGGGAQEQAQQQRRAPAPKPAAEKRTGPCTHCGVEESPQWRKGPPGKPVLCNACGTRYRRTHQLGPAVPSSAYRTQGGGSARR